MHDHFAHRLGTLPALLALLLLTSFLNASDWPQLRGPNRDGISNEKGHFPEWTGEYPKQMWSKSLGTGTSAAAIGNGKVYTMGFRKGKEIIYCLNATTGENIWTYEYPSKLDPKFFEGGSRGVPTIDGKTVYTVGHRGEFHAFHADTGKILWKLNLLTQFNTERPEWGNSTTPLIVDNMLIMLTGAKGSLVAIDKRNGKTIWQQPGYSTSYSSPVRDPNNPDNSFIFEATGLSYFKISDGTKLWHYPWKTDYDLNITMPQPIGKHVFITSGYRHGSALFKYNNNSREVIWETKEMANHFGGVVLHGNHIYGFHGNTGKRDSYFGCQDPQTGKILWQESGLGAGNTISVYGKLLLLSEFGELVLVDPSPESYQEIDRVQVLNGVCFASPAFANGMVYCRNNKGKMVCYKVGQPMN